ncbi:MAG: hypothetical protein ACKVT2_22075 [Saprospiraceae bacterium]
MAFPDSSTKTTQALENLHISAKKQKKPRLFQKFRAIKALKKLVHEQALNGEKASKMARIALGIFAGSLLCFSLGKAIPVLVYLGVFGFLISNGMAIAILAKKEKGNSRAIAFVITITSLVLVLIALLLLLFLLLFLTALFG